MRRKTGSGSVLLRGMRAPLLMTVAVVWALLSGCDADEGKECVDDDDCGVGERCVLGSCEMRPTIGCSEDADCPAGQTCFAGTCSGGDAIDPDAIGDGDGDDMVVVVPCSGEASAPLPGELRLNEILSAPLSGVDDTNCDGLVEAGQDEFVELVNDSDKQLRLDGIELQVNGTTKHTLSGCLDAGRGLVVYGGGTSSCGGLAPSRAEVSEKSFQLSNSGTSVGLLSAGAMLDTVTVPSLGSSNSSWVRVPDFSGEFDRHDSVVEERHSAGRCTGGGELVAGCMPGGGPMGCTGAAPMAGELRINEVHSAPSSDDTNCDGVPDSRQDEFVEIVNNTDLLLSLDGVELQVNGNTKLTLEGCLDPNRGLVVYSGGAAMCTDLGGTQALVADSALSLSNSGTSVGLVLAGAPLDQVTVPSLSGASLTRNPDFTGEFVEHDSVVMARFSAGHCINGAELLRGCMPGTPGDVSTDTDVVSDTTDTTDTAVDTTPDIPPPCDPPGAGDLVLNELLYDPATVATGGGDANCDGVQGGSNSHDEFVEIVNVAATEVLLRGVSITYNGTAKYTFDEDICLQPSQAALVFGGGTPSCPEFAGAVVRVGTTTLGFTNGSGSVALLDAGGTPFTLGTTSWATSGDASDTSLQRSPELTGAAFVPHDTVATDGRKFSPGTCIAGGDFSTGCP